MSNLSERDLALFNMGSYENPHYHSKQVGADWSVDDELSDHHSTIYHNPNTKHTVVAFRGSAEKHDIGTDALLFLNLGAKTNRFKDANALTDKVIQKYGKQNTSLTGHSLGGAIASNVSKNKDLDTTTFSKGRTLLPTKNAPREKSLRSILDPLSGSAIIPSAFSLPNLLIGGSGRLPKSTNPHSLANFI